MVRLAALLVCTAPAVFCSAASVGGLRGEKQTIRQLGGDHGDHGEYPETTDAPMTDAPMTKAPESTPASSTAAPVNGTDAPTMPTNGTAPPEVMPPTTATFEHLGCYNDNKSDRVLGHKLVSPTMTPEVCLMHCNIRGAAYMALQYGHECWCSREKDLDYERHGGIGVCDVYCEGDEMETCGGYNAFDLYKLELPKPSSDPEYMECFADAKHDRVMGDMIVKDDMSNEACRAHCVDQDALYYATQYGNECWCGRSDVFEDYERHGTGNCNMGCPGDVAEACGGHNSFSLFRFMENAEPTVPGTTMAPIAATPAPFASSAPSATPSPSGGMPNEASASPIAMTATPISIGTDYPATKAPNPCGTNHPTKAPTMGTASPADRTNMPTMMPVGIPADKPTGMPVYTTMAPKGGDEYSDDGDMSDDGDRATDAPDAPDVDDSGGGQDDDATEFAAGEFKRLLELHNAVRCIHAAEPLVWSDIVAVHAKEYAAEQVANNCGNLEHSTGNGYGENLYSCWGGVGSDCYSEESAMFAFYDREVTDDNDKPLAVSDYEGHATQILWKSTTELGCALDSCQKDSKTHYLLVCNYNPPGNYRGETENEVMLPMNSAEACDYSPLADQ